MSLSRTKSNDATGLTPTGAAGASNSDVLADEDDDAEQGVITKGLVPLGDGSFDRSASSDRFQGPTNEFREN